VSAEIRINRLELENYYNYYNFDFRIEDGISSLLRTSRFISDEAHEALTKFREREPQGTESWKSNSNCNYSPRLEYEIKIIIETNAVLVESQSARLTLRMIRK